MLFHMYDSSFFRKKKVRVHIYIKSNWIELSFHNWNVADSLCLWNSESLSSTVRRVQVIHSQILFQPLSFVQKYVFKNLNLAIISLKILLLDTFKISFFDFFLLKIQERKIKKSKEHHNVKHFISGSKNSF